MSTNHYIVAHIDHAWQFSVRGDVTAPFASKEEAVEAAVADAKQGNLPDVAVVVRDTDLTTQTVWTPEVPFK